MTSATPPGIDPPCDTRRAQMYRAALFMQTRPDGITLKELQAACDLGSGTKVVSEMTRAGFGLFKGWRTVTCAGGASVRRVRVYVLTAWPQQRQKNLFDTE